MILPLAGVQFCMQRGKGELVGAVVSKGLDLRFDFEVRAKLGPDGGVRLLGPFVQGPPSARFVYICIGTYAGQTASPWSRRAKVPLTGIDWAMIEAGAGNPLAASYNGTMKDGSPAAATVKLIRPWSRG
jgi:hypothetical protein